MRTSQRSEDSCAYSASAASLLVWMNVFISRSPNSLPDEPPKPPQKPLAAAMPTRVPRRSSTVDSFSSTQMPASSSSRRMSFSASWL